VLAFGLASASALRASDGKRVLFVLDGGDETSATTESLRAAVQAQLAGSASEVVFVEFDGDPETLRAQADAARAMAESHDAMGVFWLETGKDGAWLLYLAERGADRILVRRLEVIDVSTGTEAVGVITGHSTDALAEGRTIGMQAVEMPVPMSEEPEISPFAPEPEKPKAPVEPEPGAGAPRGLRLGVGYWGSTYSDQLPYQHGTSADAAWVFSRGPLVTLRFVTTGTSTSKGDLVTLELARTGGAAMAGWRWAWDPLTVELDAGYHGEAVSRWVLSGAEGLETALPRTRWQHAFGAETRVEIGVTGVLGIFAGLGGFWVLNDFRSIAIIDGESRVVSSPHRIRLSGSLGLSVWP
jgi:hypothetical protein